MSLTDDLNHYLKYGADAETVAGLLKPLEDPNSAEVQPNSHHRLVAADALQENGRESEAHLLRSPHPIYMHRGRVHHARGLIGDANRFRRGYQDAAFFSTVADQETGASLDDMGLGLSDMHPETMREMYEDALHFYHSHHHLIPAGEAERAGADFWFNRNGHGVGFWSYPEVYGDHATELSEAAHSAGEYDLHAEPDGPDAPDDTKTPNWTIYGSGGTGTHWGQKEGLVAE